MTTQPSILSYLSKSKPTSVPDRGTAGPAPASAPHETIVSSQVEANTPKKRKARGTKKVTPNVKKGKAVAIHKKGATKLKAKASLFQRRKSESKPPAKSRRKAPLNNQYEEDEVKGSSGESSSGEDVNASAKPASHRRTIAVSESDREEDDYCIPENPNKGVSNQTIEEALRKCKNRIQVVETTPHPSSNEPTSPTAFFSSKKPSIIKAASYAGTFPESLPNSGVNADLPIETVAHETQTSQQSNFEEGDIQLQLEPHDRVDESEALFETHPASQTSLPKKLLHASEVDRSELPSQTPPGSPTSLPNKRFHETGVDKSEPGSQTPPASQTSLQKKRIVPDQERSAPKLLRKKALSGKPNCLAGKRFVITGLLDSLQREDCADIIKSLGGAVTSAISSKTTHVIVGSEPGLVKLENAKHYGIDLLNEEQLYEMIASAKEVAITAAPIVKIQTAEVPLRRSETANKGCPMSAAAGANPCRMWVDKYQPVTSKDLCANPGLITKLKQFLNHWPNTEGDQAAVLLSGPPGIGKSSAAAICAREAGYVAVEMNASTTRSKKALAAHIKELLQCHSISEYFGNERKSKNNTDLHKTVLIMDEVDGMSSGDRGGMQELISFIKKTKVPIICICNDRASPKVKTLANYCLDLRFRRPMASQITQRLQSIAHQEGLSVFPNVFMKLVETTHGDIRQMLNIMQMWRSSSKTLSFEDAKNAASKDFENSPFELAVELFRPISHLQPDWLPSRMDVYFTDPNLIPIMVQGNYLNSIPQLSSEEQERTKNNHTLMELAYLEHFAKAADSISDGDLIDLQIRRVQSWSLMPVHSVISSVAPGAHIAGRLQGRIEFPQWLGKNSTRLKNQRLLSDLHSHMTARIAGGSAQDVNLDYLPALRHRLTQPLTQNGQQGIDEVLSAMNHYNLTRSDFDIVLELGETICGKVKIESKVKAALTRALTQRGTAISSSKKSRLPTTESAPPVDDEILDRSEPEMDEDDLEQPEESVTKNKATAVRKTSASSKSKSNPAKRKATGKASSSKRTRTAK